MSAKQSDERTGQERINALLAELVVYIELDEANIKTYVEELCDIYSDEDFRHSYSEISLVLEGLRPDERDSLSAHIHELDERSISYIDNDYPDVKNRKEIRKNIQKLCDHVDLECLRLGRIDRVGYIGKDAAKQLSAADGRLQETENRATDLEKRVTGFQEQNITILGIFAGLVITFSGVIQVLSSGLSNLTNVTAKNVTFFVCLSFLFLYNIVFLLLYCISKIAGTSIASSCKKRNCSSCQSCKTIFGRLHKKYPYVFYFNILGVILCAILCWIAH